MPVFRLPSLRWLFGTREAGQCVDALSGVAVRYVALNCLTPHLLIYCFIYVCVCVCVIYPEIEGDLPVVWGRQHQHQCMYSNRSLQTLAPEQAGPLLRVTACPTVLLPADTRPQLRWHGVVGPPTPIKDKLVIC